ncbi:hypothetical protein [Streptomyces sp. NPDC003036]|uniref:hypothetical protein n=1 Tax=Streptomyces sp. NPDC003036 TaxID=3154442 RepID=UPI0033A40D18
MTAPTVTVAELLNQFPSLASYVRPGTLLRPSTGSPGPYESSVGGAPLWPADEPWPCCQQPHLVYVREKLTDAEREVWQSIQRNRRQRHRPGEAHVLTAEEVEARSRIMDGGSLDLVAWERVRLVPQPVTGDGLPMVPVLQLYARDAPALHWPSGTDLLQLLWCPQDHAEPEGQPRYWGPVVELRYRNSAEIGALAQAPSIPDGAKDVYLPAPCRLDTVEMLDLPDQDELPAELYEHVEERAGEQGTDYHRVLGCLPGWKAGGWPSWHLTDFTPLDCSCTARMRLLLTVDSGGDPGLSVGRHGELRVFYCPEDQDHPVRLNLQ